MLPDAMYNNNSHTEDNKKAAIQDAVSSISPEELSWSWTCLLDMMHLLNPKESISSNFYEYSQQNPNIKCNTLN